MTKAAMVRAFRRLDSVEQAAMLRELAAALAESLLHEDKADLKTTRERKHEEANARPWRQVREQLKGTRSKRRNSV